MASMRMAFEAIYDTVHGLRTDVSIIMGFASQILRIDYIWTRVHGELRKYQKPFGRNRSLVRIIGSWLPLKSSRRVHLKLVEIRATDWKPYNHKGILNSLKQTPTWSGGVCNKNRLQLKALGSQSTYLTNCLSAQDVALCTSTPKRILSQHNISMEETLSSDCQIIDLDMELERLRSQIAAIIALKEARQKMPVVTPVCFPTTPGKFLPPPPPPPLPSQPLYAPKQIAISQCKSNEKVLDASDSKCCSTLKPGQTNLRVNFSEVLKDIGNVKLRKIERSPGGTPIKKIDPLHSGSDPCAVIAAALKRRFANLQILQESFEKENVDMETVWDSSSSFNSPHINNM